MEQILVYFFTYKEAIFVIALSIFLGIEVISNVPSVLHTPLMSGANAISGVIIIGGIILVGHADTTTLSLELILGFFAVGIWENSVHTKHIFFNTYVRITYPGSVAKT